MITADPFEFTVEPNAFIESLRVLTILLGICVFSAALVRFLDHIRVASSVAYIGVGVLTAVQGAVAVGDPLYPWRLTLLVTINLAAGVDLYQSRRRAPG